MNVLIHADFLSEKFPVLVEYEIADEFVLIDTIRLVRQVVNGGQIYSRSDGTYLSGPVYEAAWIHGKPDVNNLLTSAQITKIADKVQEALKGPHISIPEESIVHLEV